jgi:hypothetical protein
MLGVIYRTIGTQSRSQPGRHLPINGIGGGRVSKLMAHVAQAFPGVSK